MQPAHTGTVSRRPILGRRPTVRLICTRGVTRATSGPHALLRAPPQSPDSFFNSTCKYGSSARSHRKPKHCRDVSCAFRDDGDRDSPTATPNDVSDHTDSAKQPAAALSFPSWLLNSMLFHSKRAAPGTGAQGDGAAEGERVVVKQQPPSSHNDTLYALAANTGQSGQFQPSHINC